MKQLSDIFYLREAFHIARAFSNDANTQTGAVIISPTGKMISHGANAIYGLNDPTIKLSAPEKYKKLTHAEQFAIRSAIDKGMIDLTQATLYATWTPCESCFNLIKENKIKRIVVPECTTRWYNEEDKNKASIDWTQSIETAKQEIKKLGIQYDVITDIIDGIEILFKNEYRTP